MKFTQTYGFPNVFSDQHLGFTPGELLTAPVTSDNSGNASSMAILIHGALLGNSQETRALEALETLDP